MQCNWFWPPYTSCGYPWVSQPLITPELFDTQPRPPTTLVILFAPCAAIATVATSSSWVKPSLPWLKYVVGIQNVAAFHVPSGRLLLSYDGMKMKFELQIDWPAPPWNTQCAAVATTLLPVELITEPEQTYVRPSRGLTKKTFPVTRDLKSEVYGRATCALPNWSPPGVSTGEADRGWAATLGTSWATGLALRSRSGVQNFSVCPWVSRSTCGDCTTPSGAAAAATGADATSAPPATKPATARKVFSRNARIPICSPPDKCTTRRSETDLDSRRGRQRGNGHDSPVQQLRM